MSTPPSSASICGSLETSSTATSVLINGLGRYSGGPSSDLAIINVTQGKRYRFRLISISCDPNFVFSIDGHNLTVIEADGIETDPVVVDSIQIYAGESFHTSLSASADLDVAQVNGIPSL